MITITRRLAGQMRVVFRKALNITRRFGPALHFTTGPDGIRVRAKFGDGAVEYHGPGSLPQDEMWVPFELLSDVEARKDDPVQIEMLGDGRVVAGWRDGKVPQTVQYDPVEPKDAGGFPKPPRTLTQNAPRLLTALHECMQTTDPDSTRYALSCVQLRGSSGDMVATDGRQVLLERGFDFPWDEALLLPRTLVFGAKELPQDEPVAIGKTAAWISVRVGPWTFHAKIDKAGRFPETDGHIPQADSAAARFRMSVADAEFLSKNLPRLPGDDDFNLPVTLDLNGSVAIRAKAADQPQPTELVLSNSTASGQPMRVNTNRTFLARAVKLGFDEVLLYSPKVPVMCRDDHRYYVWALLDPDSTIKPTDDAIRIESSAAEQDPSTTNRKPRRQKTIMPRPTTNENVPAKKNGRVQTPTNGKADDQDIDTLIEQAEAVKVSLRDSLSKTGELLSALKRHRKQSKAVQTALVSLRRLQAVDA